MFVLLHEHVTVLGGYWESTPFTRAHKHPTVDLLRPPSLVPGHPLFQWPQRGCHQFYLSTYISATVRSCWVWWPTHLNFCHLCHFNGATRCDFSAVRVLDLCGVGLCPRHNTECGGQPSYMRIPCVYSTSKGPQSLNCHTLIDCRFRQFESVMINDGFLRTTNRRNVSYPFQARLFGYLRGCVCINCDSKVGNCFEVCFVFSLIVQSWNRPY